MNAIKTVRRNVTINVSLLIFIFSHQYPCFY